MRNLYLVFALLLSCFGQLQAQVVNDLFQQKTSLANDYHAVASKYQALELNSAKLTSLRGQSPSTLKLQLPFENRQLNLDLKKVTLTADNFSVIEALPGGGRQTVAYSGGSFYQGKIEGQEKSFATIAIFNNQIMGVIADNQSNIVLGAIESNGVATNEYTLYREKDLNIANPFSCATDETPIDGVMANQAMAHTPGTEAVGEPVDVYFECDFKFYQDKGSSTQNVINYVLGFFNNTALIYANENVQIQVSQILVWTVLDPEAAAGLNTTSTVLPSFRDRMISTNYIGDYAHFLSTRSLGGGIAYILPNPCQSAKQFRSAVSAINNTYNNFPTYSWTVMVVTHELGHNFGSNHTQWCGWVGGALDNCVATEGGCPPGPAPVNGGTVMSYCHLVPAGINLVNGFGQQPGDRIRSVIGAANCFGICRMTISLAKVDASCGQNNGSATVTAINGTGATTYTWSNGQTGTTLANVGPGTYNVTVADAANCQVMGVVTIVNSGPTLNATLIPGTATSFCTGGSILLTVTNNVAYTYQWYKDNILIPSATTNTYTATSTGNYSVIVTSGACTVTRSVQITEVPVPVANIAAGGATTFCAGGSVVLNGNAGGGYTYQWYNNGVAIGGATNPTYTATTSGSYTVKVSAGTCESTSTAVTVTVNTVPLANVTAGGATSFCTGGSVTLSASTGAGYNYQWYNNAAPIGGATSSTYNANASGSYTVKVTANNCEVTSSPIVVTLNQTPVATITAGGAVAFCSGGNVTLSATTGTGYTYQWYNNGVAINNATNSTYNASTSGNYTVKVTANTCEVTSSATTVTVSPAPQAVTTAGGATSFCNGGSVIINANTGTGYTYQWFNNGTAVNGATNANYSATSSGSYTVTITLGTCLSTSSATNVTVWANPVVTVTPASSTIQKFQTQTLTASGATSYNWTAQAALVNSTATSGVVRPLTTTNYTIEGTDNNGCKGTANATVTVIGCGDVTGITATAYSPSRVIVRWTNPQGVTADTLQYRKAGTTVWTKIYVTGQEYELNGLDPATAYEYNIIALCSTTTVFLASGINTFNTAVLDDDVYIKLFSNPVNTASRLEIVVDKPFTMQTIVYDNSGKQVMNLSPSQTYPAGQVITQVNPERLANGLYLIAVNINGKVYTVKMVVNR